MKRNTDLDLIRAILIILMILIHIENFGNAYPHLKAGILSFMMPTFLIITGYLVNIEKSPKQMGIYLMCLALPYVIMVSGFSVLSYFMPVRDGIGIILLTDLREDICHIYRSLLVYPDDDYLWHSLLYQFQGGYLGKPQTRKNDDEYHYKPLHLRHPTLAGIQDTRSFAQCRSLLFHRYSNSPMPHRVWQDIPSFPCSFTALAQLAGLRGMVRLGMPGCNLLLLVLHFVIDVDT